MVTSVVCLQDSGVKTKTSFTQRIEEKEVELEKRKQEVDQHQEATLQLKVELERLKNAQKDMVAELRTSKDKVRAAGLWCESMHHAVMRACRAGVVLGSRATASGGDAEQVQGDAAATEAGQQRAVRQVGRARGSRPPSRNVRTNQNQFPKNHVTCLLMVFLQ